MMAGVLFEKDARISRVTTLSARSAQALNDPLRIRILEILSHKQMTTEEIAKVLRRSGHKKATTTIRHHLETLKNAGLIEVTKIVEVRGAIMKYYFATVRTFSYAPPSLDEHSKLVEDTSLKLLKVLRSVIQDKKFATSFMGKGPCSLCKTNHYKEYVALEILNAALSRTLAEPDYKDMLTVNEQHVSD
jgi:DNA-binding transcriptional ArsR family regulator